MLDLAHVDLAMLAEALQDHTGDHRWWLVPATGAIEMTFEWGGADEDHGFDPEAADAVFIEPVSSGEGYQDMVDFTDRVSDPNPRRDLERALAGRGAFRRFKDALFDYTELRAEWFAFHDARMRRRAIAWLRDERLIDEAIADAAMAEVPEPEPPLIGDADRIGGEVAAGLRALYGARFRQLWLFGSRARGDEDPDSDLDLLVVLDAVDSRIAEIRRMSGLLWEETLRAGILVSGFVCGESEFSRRSRPVLESVAREGRRLA